MTYMSPTTGRDGPVQSGFLEPVFRPFGDLARRIKRYNEYARAEIQLRALSDHELADIGLTRDTISQRVWEDFERH
jgi:uncharacterized protein YjiS (DUF1127 family)